MPGRASIRIRKIAPMNFKQGERDAFIERFDAGADIVKRLDIYADLLLKWQKSINLVGPTTLTSVWMRHFWDSAQLVPLAMGRKTWLDLGSGAGFPGLVAAIFLSEQAGASVQLIESDQRKCAFLREVSRETGAAAVVHNARCEDVLRAIKADVIVSRAMAPMPDLMDLVKDDVENGSTGLFLKGRDIASELTRTPSNSNFLLELFPSKVDPAGSIVRLRANGREDFGGFDARSRVG